MNETTGEIQPFRIDVPQAALDDLQGRLRHTRWPDVAPGDDWSYGVARSRVQELVRYWVDEYEWRQQKARLNAFAQGLTTIEGQRIHFLHAGSPEPDALPLVLTHGWPGSVVEFLGVIGPLIDPRAHGADPADAFHVVAPSLPGYGFSGPTTEEGWDSQRIARAWVELMHRLGYDRFGVQGGDWGSIVSPDIGRAAPDRVVGVHVNALVTPIPQDPSAMEALTDDERVRVELIRRWYRERSGYAAIQATRPPSPGVPAKRSLRSFVG
jgi:pimeloyl-ACP methyl ester carboxylesterase